MKNLVIFLLFLQCSTIFANRNLKQKRKYNLKPRKPSAKDIRELTKSIRNMKDGRKFVSVGDMVMTKADFNIRFKNAPTPKVYTGNLKWNEVIEDGRIKIQVELDSASFGQYSNYASTLLTEVMTDYKAKTAIDFVGCGGDSGSACGSGGHGAWLILSAAPSNGLTGCSSYVGRWGDTNYRGTGGQGVSLGQGCLYKHTMIHEIMHALGWTHEQNRPDRDDFVEIIWDNISPRMRGNFATEKAGKVFGTEYDPMSVMQYSSAAFSQNGGPTIRSLDPKKPIPDETVYWSEKHINKGMTDDDAFEINNVYTLAEHCKKEGKIWAYTNEANQTCVAGTGNCIKKGERVETGSTCKDAKSTRMDLETTTGGTTGTGATSATAATSAGGVTTTAAGGDTTTGGGEEATTAAEETTTAAEKTTTAGATTTGADEVTTNTEAATSETTTTTTKKTTTEEPESKTSVFKRVLGVIYNILTFLQRQGFIKK